MTPPYVLTRAAEADLREVIGYTRRQWGVAQARRYASELQRCIEALVAGEGQHRLMTDLHSGLRMRHCEHHYIFCLPQPEAPALIIGILHERMDIMARVAGRLG